jgi:hypothetical protein
MAGYYYDNKKRSKTVNKKPSRTEQSMAKDTDINTIVQRFAQTGQAPGAPANPIWADFSELPTDLRGFIEMGRSIRQLTSKLPEQLRGIPHNELMSLTPDELQAKLNPPAQQPAKEEPK